MGSHTNPAYQIYPADILRSADLRKCTWQTRGIWWDILALMWFEKEQGKMKGTKEEICRSLGCTLAELDQLLVENSAHNFANVHFRNGIVTIINRRMHKAFLARTDTKKRVFRHRHEAQRKSNTNVTFPSSSSSSSSCNKGVTDSNSPLQISYTLEQVKDACILLGIPEQHAQSYLDHYGSQGWKKANGQVITELRGHMRKRWTGSGWDFDERADSKGKRGLPVIIGKICSRPGCGMPAVYKTSGGAYDNYYCTEDMPEKVKEKYA